MLPMKGKPHGPGGCLFVCLQLRDEKRTRNEMRNRKRIDSELSSMNEICHRFGGPQFPEGHDSVGKLLWIPLTQHHRVDLVQAVTVCSKHFLNNVYSHFRNTKFQLCG